MQPSTLKETLLSYPLNPLKPCEVVPFKQEGQAGQTESADVAGGASRLAPISPTQPNTGFVASVILGLLLLACCSCAVVRPHVVETFTATNGVVTRREIWLPAFVVWPATQTVEKQRATIGKTISAGLIDTQQETTGTNAIEALKVIDSILGKLPK